MKRLRVHPVAGIALSVLCFFILDAVIFRSGLYARIVSPETTAGKLIYTVQYERARQADRQSDVLLLGNSKMEWAFSVKHYEQFAPQSHIHFIQGAVSGSTEEWWYYMLRDLDPSHDRYAAIVIPIAGYKIGPWREDFENRFDNAQVLAPILKTADWPAFLATYSDPDVRKRAALLALSAAHIYALDLQDLLVNPRQRVRDLERRGRIGARWMYDDPGLPGTMEDLKVDWGTDRVIAYPARFSEFKKRETDSEFLRPDPAEAQRLTARNVAFETEWLQRMINAYAGSPTRLLFLQMPRWPMPLPSLMPLASAPDIRDKLPLAPAVLVMDPNEFGFLEVPQYFADILHLNRQGRLAFTEKLGTMTEQILRDQ